MEIKGSNKRDNDVCNMRLISCNHCEVSGREIGTKSERCANPLPSTVNTGNRDYLCPYT